MKICIFATVFYMIKMNKSHRKVIPLGVIVSHSEAGIYALIMGIEGDDLRRIPILIGALEAQAIIAFMRKEIFSRPLLHDVMMDMFSAFGMSLHEVVIYKKEKKIYYSRLILRNSTGDVKEIDTRTSDAVALALRMNAPIYMPVELIEKEAVVFEKDDNVELHNAENKYANYPDEKLEELLQTAIRDELYEQATLIRDEIKKRKEK